MVKRILVAQILIVWIATIFVALLANHHDGFSTMVGGGIALLSTLYFAGRFFRVNPHDSHKVLKTLYKTEVGKWFITGLLFFLVIRFLTVNMGYVFVGYLLTQSAFWWAPLINNKVGTKLV